MEKPTIISLTEATLNLDALIEKITLPTTGAIAMFTGIVRGQTTQGISFVTAYLDYEAYQPSFSASDGFDQAHLAH
jgi:molybdopterin synthase catalytic subunit